MTVSCAYTFIIMNDAGPNPRDVEWPGLRPLRREGSRMSQNQADPSPFPAQFPQPSGRAPSENKPPAKGAPSFQLVLLTDDLHDLHFIIQTIMDLTRLSRSDATH